MNNQLPNKTFCEGCVNWRRDDCHSSAFTIFGMCIKETRNKNKKLKNNV